ncbi:hypothetical protein DL96DRAFT_1537151 [Flagelloscypha sp. PMI_526]|nr:hypothetical protein DL96DRAFT_1537151 [Flagelloscypha sp. PMI_526]
MNSTGAAATPNGNNGTNNANKKQETLFGPSLGLLSQGPSWTVHHSNSAAKSNTEELTPEIVKSWIERSKDPSVGTTTLQALVNLKRPTLRLTPLTHDESKDDEEEEDHSKEHAITFTYDSIAPKTGIYIHVLVPATHPDCPPERNEKTGLGKVQVFEMVTEGGFNRTLALSDGARLDLAQFSATPPAAPASALTPSKSPSPAPGAEPAANTSTAAASTSTTDAAAGPAQRRRFTNFHFRKRSTRQGERSAGPALAVMDASESKKDANSTDDDEDGVKVMIRLAALDEHGREMEVINEQVTYLQVVRFGAAPTNEKKDDAAATTEKKDGEASTDAAAKAEDEDSEDTRPWVVKVAKREATLGPHTFHLHEIYGLSSATSDTTVEPTAPLPKSEAATDGEAGEHTYPPTSPVVPTVVAAHEEETTSECLLCLSSPREVVLLPCRHLVACRECAVNMVEFGAGGSITQPADDTPAAGGDATPAAAGGANSSDDPTADADATTTTPAAPAAVVPAAAPAPTRRKRKAKGWFCPVCRQPYTSLLRITTQPPPPPEVKKLEEEDGSGKLEVDNGGAEGGSGGGGILGSITRPGLFSRLSANGANAGDASTRV